MKILIFFIGYIISQSVFAIGANTLAACKQGSRTYASYAVSLNQYIKKTLNDNKNLNSNQLNEVNKFIRKSHEEFKDDEENKHYKVSEILHSKKQGRLHGEVSKIISRAKNGFSGILEKENAVADFRNLIGATDPTKAAEGTIRKIYAESIAANAVHGSDSDENAAIEGNFFFSSLERF